MKASSFYRLLIRIFVIQNGSISSIHRCLNAIWRLKDEGGRLSDQSSWDFWVELHGQKELEVLMWFQSINLLFNLT